MRSSFSISASGSFANTMRFLNRVSGGRYLTDILNKYGQAGVTALSNATPVESGKTASSWGYRIEQGRNQSKIIWTNSSMTENGMPIVILLQYGHGTRNGGYVKGRDFINKAIRPIFDEIAESAWKEVTFL